MTENEIQKLNFERQDDISDLDKPFHYYVYNIASDICLISNSSNELDGERWFVEFFDSPEVRFYEKSDVKKLISSIERNKV